MLLLNGQTESEYSMLLAVPCARDQVEVVTQGHNLRTGFINYLQQKQAAGIVNIQEPGSNQVRRRHHWPEHTRTSVESAFEDLLIVQ